MENPQFITVATATGTFEPGDYEILVTWDDAVRVFIDEKPVINEWVPSLYDLMNRHIKWRGSFKRVASFSCGAY